MVDLIIFQLEGIVLYNIVLNGCLNGGHTNEDPVLDGQIFNVIAKSKEKKKMA
jgi:hypothetical protein